MYTKWQIQQADFSEKVAGASKRSTYLEYVILVVYHYLFLSLSGLEIKDDPVKKNAGFYRS